MGYHKQFVVIKRMPTYVLTREANEEEWNDTIKGQYD